MSKTAQSSQSAASGPPPEARIGVDVGGTKIAAVLLGAVDQIRAEARIPAPKQNYDASVRAIAEIVAAVEGNLAPTESRPSVGIGMPGSISHATGMVQNANSTWINGRPFHRDIEAALGRPVRLANDANCFALSEAVDGAAAGANCVLGVILGTGCGGGIVVGGKLLEGPHAIAGEWGHCPLPWVTAEEVAGPTCWCGRQSCLETWISGSGLAADHARVTGDAITGEEIVRLAASGDIKSTATLARHADRLGRALAMVSNILDPDVIVLGGGLSQLPHLYDVLPDLICRHMFCEHSKPDIRRPQWGDASGVRGAARLWP
jgi:fructokinase